MQRIKQLSVTRYRLIPVNVVYAVWVADSAYQAAVSDSSLLDLSRFMSHTQAGWSKPQSYVVAFGRNGAADVTRRYTADFAKALARRTLVPEAFVKVRDVLCNRKSAKRAAFAALECPARTGLVCRHSCDCGIA